MKQRCAGAPVRAQDLRGCAKMGRIYYIYYYTCSSILYILVHQCVLKKVFAGESAGERCLSSSTSEEEE